jgi:predicted dehydrogenase
MGDTKVGVLGYGYWGSKHVRVLSAIPDVDVVVIENQIERLAAAGLAFPNAKCIVNLDQALDEVDAVIIATAASTHAALARRCISAGVHVLVEKPLTTDPSQAEALIELAAERDVVLMAGHTFEYNPAVHKLQELVQSGELGKIRYIDTARLNLGLYQSDVNVMWDLAPHDISIVNYLLGSTPTHVSAWAQGHARYPVEDVAHIQLEYPEFDTMAYVHVSWLDPRKVRRVTVVGSKKMAVYNDVDPNEPIRIYDTGIDDTQSLHPGWPISYRVGDIRSPRVSGPEPLMTENEHFIDCIRTGATPMTDGHSGLAVVATIAAAETSASQCGTRTPIEASAFVGSIA